MGGELGYTCGVCWAARNLNCILLLLLGVNKLGDFVLIEDGIDYLVRGTGVTSMRFFVGKRFLYGEPSFDSGDSSVLNRRGD